MFEVYPVVGHHRLYRHLIPCSEKSPEIRALFSTHVLNVFALYCAFNSGALIQSLPLICDIHSGNISSLEIIASREMGKSQSQNHSRKWTEFKSLDYGSDHIDNWQALPRWGKVALAHRCVYHSVEFSEGPWSRFETHELLRDAARILSGAAVSATVPPSAEDLREKLWELSKEAFSNQEQGGSHLPPSQAAAMACAASALDLLVHIRESGGDKSLSRTITYALEASKGGGVIGLYINQERSEKSRRKARDTINKYIRSLNAFSESEQWDDNAPIPKKLIFQE